MKPIPQLDLNKLYQRAVAETEAELATQVVNKLKEQLMAVHQLEAKAKHSVIENDKLQAQLLAKQALLIRMRDGDWAAVPETAKERDDKTKNSPQPEA